VIDVVQVGREQILGLGDVLGRLGRRLGEDEYAQHLHRCACGRVEVLAQLFWPTAGEVVRGNLGFGADEDEAVRCALEDVDRRVEDLRRRLGVKTP
jgi:hypothetical protein